MSEFEFEEVGNFKEMKLPFEEFLSKFDVYELFPEFLEADMSRFVDREDLSLRNKREIERNALYRVLPCEWFIIYYYYREAHKMVGIELGGEENKRIKEFVFDPQLVVSSAQDETFQKQLAIHLL